MATIIGIAGSLRKGSYNRALLRAAAEAAPPTVSVEIATIEGVPLYDGDLENETGVPAPVQELKDRIVEAAGLLMVTPEYNNAMPGVLKNAIDWMTRPPADIPKVFGGKPVAIMGATPSAGGTRLSQTSWLPVFRTLGMKAWFGRQLYVARAGDVFDADGNLVDEKIRARLVQFMAGFADFVAR